MIETTKPRTFPIAFVAQLMGTTIAKAHAKFHAGEVPVEDVIEWNEKHSGHVDYLKRNEMIDKADRRIPT